MAGNPDAWDYYISQNQASIRMDWSAIREIQDRGLDYREGNTGELETLATRTAPDESDGYR